MLGTGLGMTGISAVIMTAMFLRAAPFEAGGLWSVFITGLALLVAGVVQVPGWARERTRQMEAIIERVRLMVATDPPPSLSPGPDR